MSAKVNLPIFLFIAVLVHLHHCLFDITLEFDRYEIEYSVLGTFDNIRIRKYNRTTPVINGTYHLIVDLDNDYEVGVSCSRSALGNNQYDLYPMQLFPQPVCEFTKKYGRDFQYIWQNNSNFPRVTEEGLCPYPKGVYWVKDLALDSNLIPSVIPEGYYRCYLDLFLTATKERVHHQAYYSRIRKELKRI